MQTADLYQLFLECKQTVCTDTRQLVPNSLFFALSGTNFDGNKFASQAIEKGCRYAVIDNPDYQLDERYILVENTLTALQQLATYHRQQINCPVIAITGSNGKTTTKELVTAVLATKYKVHATKGNFNNHIGVPLTLLSMPNDTEIAVIEMGASKPNDIMELALIAQPDFGLITNVGLAHLDTMGGVEGVIKTKTELYNYLKTKNGKIFIDADNQVLNQHAIGIDTIKYASVQNAEAQADVFGNISMDNANSPFINVQIKKPQALLIATQLVGEYNLKNVLAAYAVGNYFKVAPHAIQQAISNYTPTNNRSQIIEQNSNTIILDAYNANPTSMELAINNLANFNSSKNKIAILGEMLELGEFSSAAHQNIINLLIEKQIKKAYLVGEEFLKTDIQSGNTLFETFTNTEALITHLQQSPINNSLILIKGSRKNKLEAILNYI